MEVSDELLQLAAGAWPEYDWGAAEVLHGAFHVVVIPPAAAVVLRATTGHEFEPRCRREASIVRTLSLAGLPLPAPELIGDPITNRAWAAYLITRLPGIPLPATDFDRVPIEDYRRILSGFSRVDVAGLPEPRTWCGGEAWPRLVQRDLVPLLPAAARWAAQSRVAAVLEVEETGPKLFCHGDFGPHNILWSDRTPVGLIDADHACIGDPAIDIAGLISFHGVAALHSLAESAVLRRAMIHRATLSLQVAAAAHLIGSTDLRDHALRNFATRLQQGTLFDPQGLEPEDLRSC